MSDFRVDEIVNIAIEGVRIDEVVKNGIHVVMPNGATASIELSNYEGLTVERVAPAEWPPRSGDLWRDREGTLWFARPGSVSLRVEMVPGDRGGAPGPEHVLKRYGPLSLVYRAGGA